MNKESLHFLIDALSPEDYKLTYDFLSRLTKDKNKDIKNPLFDESIDIEIMMEGLDA
ncbi:hypothetical protein HMPREF0379_0088 [[Eubacterium] yurii subsp. margaretiae ATCC 43715]|jgi:hypothetical protein|nr:hypothetical protein HMPREF0379_0088 [[Eubacterium] yurii subsp. margaretiae ATCC 43715]SKC59928.1 hypothetical protein SAMN02745115_01699 [[Eubacterium] yurii]